MRLRPDKKRIYVSEAVHPEYRAVLATYLQFHDVTIETMPVDRTTGRTRMTLSPEAQKDAVAIVLQSPNFFGIIEQPGALAEGEVLAVMRGVVTAHRGVPGPILPAHAGA